jgi:hypothetical protein
MDFYKFLDPLYNAIIKTIEYIRKNNELVENSNGLRISSPEALELRTKILAELNLDATKSHVNHKALNSAKSELKYLFKNYASVRNALEKIDFKSVMFVGPMYYNTYFLSKELSKIGWKANIFDKSNPNVRALHQFFKSDYQFEKAETVTVLNFYLFCLYEYGIFHFSNAFNITFGDFIERFFKKQFGEKSEIYLLKLLGKKITYATNGCLDGVSKTSFSNWGLVNVCKECSWEKNEIVCSNSKNLEFGAFRNSVADAIFISGSNRVDWNLDGRVHEVPEFYCLDSDFYHPTLVPSEHLRIKKINPQTTLILQSFGNKSERTRSDGKDIKSHYFYSRKLNEMSEKGINLQFVNPSEVSVEDLRFIQVQADIILESLTFGWFGASGREGMMLGKIVMGNLNQEWLDQIALELPEYVNELPIINVNMENFEQKLLSLVENPEIRIDIGKKSREFALKWHDSKVGAKKLKTIFEELKETGKYTRSNYTIRKEVVLNNKIYRTDSYFKE